MRKLKLISAAALMLCILMLFTACATPKAKMSNYFEPDYVPEETVLKSYNYISELEGYIMGEYNKYFAVFEKLPDVTKGETVTSYKIFSMSKASVIATFSGIDLTFDFELYGSHPIVTVISTLVDLEVPENSVTTYQAYDANGTSIATAKRPFEAPYSFADLVIFNYAAYSVDKETGAVEKQCDVPEFLQLSECNQYNDEYFYVTDTTSTAGQILVYDRSFNLVSTWNAPSYAKDTVIFALNDGNLLVQYAYTLDSDENKYDYYKTSNGLTVKYDLVSLIVSAKDGSAKEKDLDFKVNILTTNNMLQANADEENPKYTDKFDNIAYISPIVDRKIDSSNDAMDVVLMTNKLKVKKSLKIVDGQEPSRPSRLCDGLYYATLHNGIAIFDDKGKVLNTLNVNALKITNDYIVGDAAVYNLDLTKAYDLIENDAEVMTVMDDSVFLRADTETGYDIILLCDGEQKTVFTHVYGELLPKLMFGEIKNGFYSIYNTEIGEYTYYNAKGETVVSTTTELEIVGSTDGDNLLLVGIDETLVSKYFAFIRG